MLQLLDTIAKYHRTNFYKIVNAVVAIHRESLQFIISGYRMYLMNVTVL